jgi:3-oxoadipate enol-lactonase
MKSHRCTQIRREDHEHDQIVPPFYTQELADLIPTAKRAEIPSGHLSFLEKPVDLASAMLTFLLERHPNS